MSTAVGNVEIEDRGSGTPVLVVHGSPGGVDAGRAMGRFLPVDRFRTIALSRPGYLGTPLPADPSIDGEADLFAALLDALGVDRVGVLAWSGGGPSSYRLAVRHPERVSSLIEVAALSTRWVAAAPPLSERLLFGSAAGNGLVRFLARRLPNQVVEGALASEGALRREELKAQVAAVLADPAQRAAVLAFATTVSFIGGRRAGWQNDVANFAAIDSLELERVSCPVLLIHGNADSDATIDFSYSARDALPHSRLIVMDRGTHLAFYAHPDAATVQEEARAFLSANA
ncbi:MAG TPA: alpha/beta hydrolase [Mycobacteriales bacterium]